MIVRELFPQLEREHFNAVGDALRQNQVRPMVPIDKATVAYHEAGHAVVGYRFGQRFAHLSIHTSKDVEGFCQFFSGHQNPRHTALVLLAGHAAEKRFCQAHTRKPSRSDHRKICQLTHFMSTGEFKALLKEADDLVAANWCQIQAVAQKLMETGSINGSAFAEIIEAVDNQS